MLKDDFSSVDTYRIVRSIAEWCSEHGQAESVFVSPFNQQHYVFTFPLLDHISSVSGIDKDLIGKWFNAKQEDIQRRSRND